MQSSFFEIVGDVLIMMGATFISLTALEALQRTFATPIYDFRRIALECIDCTDDEFHKVIWDARVRETLKANGNNADILFRTLAAVQRFDLAATVKIVYGISDNTIIQVFLETVNKGNMGAAAQKFFTKVLEQRHLRTRIVHTITVMDAITTLQKRDPAYITLAQKLRELYPKLDDGAEPSARYPIPLTQNYAKLARFLEDNYQPGALLVGPN